MFKIFPLILNTEFQPLQPLMKSFFVLFFGDGFEILENGTSKLVVGLKISSRQMQFEVVKQLEVPGRETWAVRWMLKLHNPQRIQRILHKPSFMGPSIIVKNSQAFTDGMWAPLFIVLFYCSKTDSGIILPCYSLAFRYAYLSH